jgi:hypothetical protein
MEGELTVVAMVEFKGDLYVATTDAVYKKVDDNLEPMKFVEEKC